MVKSLILQVLMPQTICWPILTSQILKINSNIHRNLTTRNKINIVNHWITILVVVEELSQLEIQVVIRKYLVKMLILISQI